MGCHFSSEHQAANIRESRDYVIIYKEPLSKHFLRRYYFHIIRNTIFAPQAVFEKGV